MAMIKGIELPKDRLGMPGLSQKMSTGEKHIARQGCNYALTAGERPGKGLKNGPDIHGQTSTTTKIKK